MTPVNDPIRRDALNARWPSRTLGSGAIPAAGRRLRL